MTVPVARANVRRNVRMAVALVVGQAVLCVVIGYIALGGVGSARTAAPHAVGPLAAPTGEAAPPPAGGPTSRRPAPSGRPAPPGSPRVPPGTMAAPPANPADGPQLTEAPPAAPQLMDVPTAAGTTIPSAPEATPPATAGAPNLNVGVVSPQNARSRPNAVLGEPCDKAHANDETSDGVDVVCLEDAQGNLVWQLPKQPPGQNR